MPGHIGAPIIHLSSSVSAALVGRQHKRCPLALSLAPSWGKHTTTSNKKSVEPSSSSHFGPPLNPAVLCLVALLCYFSLFQLHNGSERDRMPWSQAFFFQERSAAVRHDSCHRKRLEDSVGKGETEGGRPSAQLHSNTNSNKELVLAWQLAAWLTGCLFSNSQQLNNPCRPPLTQKPGVAYRHTRNKHSLWLMFACFPFMLATQSNILVFWSGKKEGKITKPGKVFLCLTWTFFPTLEWRTQRSSFTPLRWGQYAYLDLSQSAAPNIGALISWPNLEILSSNLIYPSWNALF